MSTEDKGTLFYVIGASGAGKDSVCNGARKAMPPTAKILFAHRYITRPADAGGENHVALSGPEFRLRQDAGLFAMAWESHGNRYGIGTEIDRWLARGLSVVVNGSRGYLETAAARYPEMVVIHIAVSREILRERLLRRGRENAAEVERRLQRSDTLPPIEFGNLHTILNDGQLSESVDHFLSVVNAHLAAPSEGS